MGGWEVWDVEGGNDELRTMVKNGSHVRGERVAVEIVGVRQGDDCRREQGTATGMWAQKGGLGNHVWAAKVGENRPGSCEDIRVRCPFDVPLT